MIVMPYSFIKRIGMLTFLLESSVKIFLEAKHSLSNQLSKCFFLLLSSGLLTFRRSNFNRVRLCLGV